jgi:hypothetical protein
MRFAYLLLPVMATCFVSSGFSAAESQDDKLVTMSTYNDGLGEKPGLKSRVQGIEDRLGKLEKTKGIRTDNPLHGYLNLDVLVWKAQGRDQYYALMSDMPPRSDGSAAVSGRIQRAKSEWKPGSRFEIGFSTVHDWNVGAIWTFYHNNSCSSKVSTTQELEPFFITNWPTRSVYHYHLNYNTVDLQFASNCCLTRNLILKPFIDVRSAWIKASDRIRFSGLQATRTGVPVDATVTMKYSWVGFGPRVGAGAMYKFGHSGFSFFGDFSGSLLYGTARLKESTQSNSDIETNQQVIHASYLEQRDLFGDLKPSIELMLGANYKWEFSHGKKAISLHAAWETNYWWDLKDYFASPDNLAFEMSSALWLMGVNIGLGFDY